MYRYVLLKDWYLVFKKWDNFKKVSIHDISQALKEHWVWFTAVLWDLIEHADNINTRIIVNTRPWYMEKYANDFILDHILDETE